MDDITPTIQEGAEMFRRTLQDEDGSLPDYDMLGVFELNTLLTMHRRELKGKPWEEVRGSVMPMSMFLAECMRHEFGGEYVTSPEEGYALRIPIGEVYPVSWVMNLIENDQSMMEKWTNLAETIEKGAAAAPSQKPTADHLRPIVERAQPILQPLDWRGRDQCVTRPLLPGAEGPLLVSYGIVEEHSNQMLHRIATDELGFELREIERTALQNWAKSPDRGQRWERTEAGGQTYLAWLGGETASSAILVPKIRKKAHEILGKETIWFIIPNRFVVIATDEVFAHSLGESMYREACEQNMAPLSPDAIVSQDGKMIAVQGPQRRESPLPEASESHDQFQQISLAPVAAFLLVAAADGELDQEEIGAFVELVEKYAADERPQLEEVCRTFKVVADNAGLLVPRMASMGGEDWAAALMLGCATADERWGEKLGGVFRRAVYGIAAAVAKASDGVSKDEKETLRMIKKALGV